MDEEKLAALRKKRAEAKELVRQALDVNGYESAFAFDEVCAFDDDIFLLDNWESEQGLQYLIGVQHFDSHGDVVHTAPDEADVYPVVLTLFGDRFSERHDDNICNAFYKKYNRFLKLWESGYHPKINPPSYYIDWAISKNLEIPWFKYAIEKKFYIPKQSAETSQNKSESPRKVENLLKALVCIAIDDYGYAPSQERSTAPKDLADAISKNGNGFSLDEKTIRGWLKEGVSLLPPKK